MADKVKLDRSAISNGTGLAGVEAEQMDLKMLIKKWGVIGLWYISPILIPVVGYFIYNFFAAPSAAERHKILGQSYSYIANNKFSEWVSFWPFLVFAIIMGIIFSRFVGNWFYRRQLERNIELESDTYIDGTYIYKTLDESNDHYLQLNKDANVEGFFILEHDPLETILTKEETEKVLDLKEKLYASKK